MEEKVKEKAKKARDAVEKEARNAAEQARKVASKLQEEVAPPQPPDPCALHYMQPRTHAHNT